MLINPPYAINIHKRHFCSYTLLRLNKRNTSPDDRNSYTSFIVQCLGTVLEKVMIKDSTDTVEQLRVNAFTLEYTIYVLPVAAQLFGEPHYRMAVAPQFRLNEAAYMRLSHTH